MGILSSIIGAGSSLLGGLFGSDSAEDQAKENYRNQKEFAQNAIQWKTQDSLKAGIHPIYGLGAQTTSFTPMSVGDPMGSAIADAGQQLGRAVDATTSSSGKTAKAVEALQLQKMGLENRLLEAQIHQIQVNSTGSPPAPPTIDQRWLVDGQGQTALGPLTKSTPMEQTPSQPGSPHMEPGAINEVGFVRTQGGGYAPVASNDAKQRMEDDIFSEIPWNIRNRLLPMLGLNMSPPPVAPPKGYDGWKYDPIKQEYVPAKRIWGEVYW